MIVIAAVVVALLILGGGITYLGRPKPKTGPRITPIREERDWEFPDRNEGNAE